MLCCESTYNLGCFFHCDDIGTGVTSTQTGTYQAVYLLANGVFRQDFEITIGNEIIVPNIFNENLVSVFSITDPAGNNVTKGGESCFSITQR